uniref:Reverse transcriptase domain-containing protein n=1 Tax=Oryzias latipes TaxID=8090 RepID=A0A3P9H128_ORYLA
MRADSMARNLFCHNSRNFWKEVKVNTAGIKTIPSVVDGASGTENILELWRQHYIRIFNCVQSDMYVANDADTTGIITTHNVHQAISRLSNNKATGLDGVSSEHVKFASTRVTPLLAMCFTAFLVHGFLPDSMIAVMLVPVIKNKAGKIGCTENYRPIALASILSKLFEIILLDMITEFVKTTHNQFGFKEKLGTDMCIYALKEMIYKYRSLNSSVFLCFLDASKAFDRVNHKKLFMKLTKRGVPKCLVRILAYWYAQQTIQVKWGNQVSEPFKSTNGVRQGGILSPILFNLYLDELSL